MHRKPKIWQTVDDHPCALIENDASYASMHPSIAIQRQIVDGPTCALIENDDSCASMHPSIAIQRFGKLSMVTHVPYLKTMTHVLPCTHPLQFDGPTCALIEKDDGYASMHPSIASQRFGKLSMFTHVP